MLGLLSTRERLLYPRTLWDQRVFRGGQSVTCKAQAYARGFKWGTWEQSGAPGAHQLETASAWW